jgi:hypothetical protein
MRFDSRSAKAVGRVDILVNNACLPKVASRAPWHKDRPAAGRAAAMLAFAAGLLVGALGARAEDAPVGPQPTAERAGADSRRMRPTAEQFAPPYQPNFSTSDARYVDELYHHLIGSLPPNSSDSRSSNRPRAAPNDDAAGSVRRWVSPR